MTGLCLLLPLISWLMEGEQLLDYLIEGDWENAGVELGALAFGLAACSALCFAGMVALAFAMERHHTQLTGAYEVPAYRGNGFRVADSLLLMMAVVPCVRTWGGSVGSVAWLVWVSAGALASVLVISLAPRWASRLAGVLGSVALADLLLTP